MRNSYSPQHSRAVATWLLIGVGMIIIQIILGGITRLTESGLSITEWKPITGTLPPLNTDAWQAEFDKYKHTDQFRYIHAGFTLQDFKFIFFWEWFHRLWAKLFALVFIAGFIYFLIRRKFQHGMIIPMIILFLLGALQAVIGWIMVKSGLVPKQMFVGHIELATHFIAAVILLCYTFWFALSLLVPKEKCARSSSLKNITICLIVMLSIQLVYGAFMAGLKAATTAPTWPDINGSMIPVWMNDLRPWWRNLIDNKIMVQFIHRGIAYILLLMTVIWYVRARKNNNILLVRTAWIPLVLVLVQVILGVATVLRSPYGNELVYLGVAHQLVGILFLLAIVWMVYLVRYPSRIGFVN